MNTNSHQQSVVVSLPSLVRKFGSDTELKEQLLDYGCRLSRVRRSRNWQLVAMREQLLIVLAAFASSNQAQVVWILSRIKLALGELSLTELSHLKSLQSYYSKHNHNHDLELSADDAMALKLDAMLKLQNNLSVSQLMSQAHCSRLQAMRALDKFEGLD